MSTSSSIAITFPGTAGIRTVTTVAELRNVLSNTISTADNMLVAGLQTLGDGKGGTYVYDAVSVVPDDGDASVTPIDVGAGAGRWLKVEVVSGDATGIAYGGEFPSVRDALDALLYVAPVIGAFAASPAVVETGTTIPTVALTWTLNKAVSTEAITGLAPLTPDARSATALGPFTSDHSWTLTANDGKTTVTASATITFRQRRYWGVSASPTLTTADILAFSGEFSTSKGKSVSYDCTGGRYPYFTYPASFGDPVGVTVGGLAFSDLVITTQSFTNASGYASNYKVIRFGNLQTGSAIAVVWG